MPSFLATAALLLGASFAVADGTNYYVYGAGSLKGQPLFYADGE